MADEPEAVCPSCGHAHPARYPYTDTTMCVVMVKEGFCGCTDEWHRR